MKKMLYSLAAVIITAAFCAVPAAAQGHDDDDVEVITREKVKKMQDMTDPAAGDKSFGDAFNTESAEKNEGEDKPEPPSINQVTTIRREIPPDTTEKQKKEKVANPHLIGVRAGFGSPTISAGGSMKLAFKESNRIDLGLNLGNFGFLGYRRSIEANAFYEWRFSLSDDGVLGWYTGGGLAGGWYRMPDIEKQSEGENPPIFEKNSNFNVGIGAVIGLEVFLTFIDPEHSLYTLKNSSLSLDVRPVVYIPGLVKDYWWGATVGISLRQKF